jgi:hypothetical protein
MISSVGHLVAVLVTLGIYSLPLWKDNPWYRVAEALFLGTSIGNVAVIGFYTLRSNTWLPLTKGDWLIIFPIILSVIFYLRFTKQYRWLSRWPLAIVISIPVAMLLRAGFTSLVKLTGISFVNRFLGLGAYGGTPLGAIDAALCLIAAISATVYFFYTIQRDNPILVQVRKIGLFMLLWYYAGQLSSAFLGYTGRNISRWAYLLKSLGIIS